MKKRVVSLGLAAMMVLSMTACGSKQEAAPAETKAEAAAEKETTAAAPAASKDAKIIKFSLSQAATEPAPLAAQEFAKEIAEKSGGSLAVEVYPDGQLGSERDVIEGLQLHTVEMVDPANAVVSNFIPEVGLFELPMLFHEKEHVYKVLDDIGMNFADKFEAQGFKLLGWFDMGTRHIMTVKKPINSIDDLKGLKIRTQEAAGNMAGFTAFGASPTPMAYNELYTSLESGVLDGAEAANTNYYLKAFYEVAPNWAICGWLECVNPVMMDLEFWNGLTAEEQAVVQEAVDNMIQLERKSYAESEDTYLEELKKAGVNITYPDTEPFREASKEAWASFADTVGGMDKIEAVVNYQYK